jgi:hypothetical protein
LDDKEILAFYKSIPLANIHRHSRDAADLEFEKKDHLIGAIDLGTGNFLGQPFFMRSSYFSQRAAIRAKGGRSHRGRGSRYGGRGGYRYIRIT